MYATILFGFSLRYFLLWILAYKQGCLLVPTGKIWCKNRSKQRRGNYKQRRLKRWKYKKRYYCRKLAPHARSTKHDTSFSGTSQPTVFTTVLNIDLHTNERSSINFDLDSSFVVCGNIASINICRKGKLF